jgi:trans-aconitate methyltransferase
MSPQQSWDPERYARNARFVADLGEPVLELLEARAGERVLDLGCGDGALTERLVKLGCDVVAVDASGEQVAAARARRLDARVADGQALAFRAEFDAVFSNAALHWMTEPDRVIAGAWRALRPGGRFVAEFGGEGCVARIVAALDRALEGRGIDPGTVERWFFPGPEEYRERLERGGFDVDWIALIPRPTPLPGDIGDWLETFAERWLERVPSEARAGLLNEVRDVLRPELQQADGSWSADYVRLRFRATRTGVDATRKP